MPRKDPMAGRTTTDYVHPAYKDRVHALMTGAVRHDPVADAHLSLARVSQLKDMAANHVISPEVARGNIRASLDSAARSRKAASFSSETQRVNSVFSDRRNQQLYPPALKKF